MRDWRKTSDGSPRAALRVLLVDDLSALRLVLARRLEEEESIEVVGQAANGRDAVALTRQLAPDVVLMDLHMPVMSGIEATRLIHAENPAVRVIGLSMSQDVDDAAAMREAGATLFLAKDTPPHILIAAMRESQRGEDRQNSSHEDRHCAAPTEPPFVLPLLPVSAAA